MNIGYKMVLTKFANNIFLAIVMAIRLTLFLTLIVKLSRTCRKGIISKSCLFRDIQYYTFIWN